MFWNPTAEAPCLSWVSPGAVVLTWHLQYRCRNIDITFASGNGVERYVDACVASLGISLLVSAMILSFFLIYIMDNRSDYDQNSNNNRCIRCSKLVFDTFCTGCGSKVPSSEEEYIISYYFRKGYPYNIILQFLYKFHVIGISLRTLKSKLRSYGLKRKSVLTPRIDVQIESAIRAELQGASVNIGYRTMWSRLNLFHGVCVPRDAVMLKLRLIDPDGCDRRKRRRLARRQYSSSGPNEVWHIDGYDKLKRFGFPIHGCIDGFSRRMLWLKALHSNNNPAVVARLFMECVVECNGCPKRVRSDCGSENVDVTAIQSYLRRRQDDAFSGLNAHIYGPSHGNQWIESWWSQYRRNRSSFIIDFFKDLVDLGSYNPSNSYQLACVRYCFVPILQKDLDEVKEYWNSHLIRKSGFGCISGRPDVLYFLPETCGGEDQTQACNTDDLTEMETYVEQSNTSYNSEIEFLEYLTIWLLH